MGRGQGIVENRYPREPGGDKIKSLPAGLLFVALVTLTAVIEAPAGPHPVLRDLWDGPHLIEEICKDQATIFYICDTGLSVCREGAVFFDARGDEIEARGFQAALIFIGRPAEIRDFVLRANLAQPVYIDPDGGVFGTLLDQDILPALALVDEEGRPVRILYGGGETLGGNLNILLEGARPEGRRWWLIIIPVAVVALAILPFVVD